MSEHTATVRTEYSVVWYDEENQMPVGPFVVYGADFEPWIPTAELGCIVMANQRTITTSAWSGYESPPTPCAPSCRTLCEGCSPEPLESASGDGLPTLASKCREQLDAVPPAAQPSWYRLKGAPRVMPPAETDVERCRRLHQLEPGYVMGCDECEASAVNYEALVSKLRRAHRMSVSDPSDRARATLYGDAADAITALVSELGARA